MGKRVTLFVFLFLIVSSSFARANQTLPADSTQQLVNAYGVLDSTSMPVIAIDTLTPKLLKPLDSLTKAHIADSLATGFGGYKELRFAEIVDEFLRSSFSKVKQQTGDVITKGDVWVLGVVFFLIAVFAVIKSMFSKQLASIVQSFFSNRALVNLNKEDTLFTSWPFLLLFVQFGFTLGMFFYLVAQQQELNYVANGFQFFLTISVVIIILYVLKIVLLRLLGFIFDVQKPVNEYISILYLSYFNASLLFMPLVLAFALSPLKNGKLYIAIAIVLLLIIFVFQFIRAAINILSQYRFSKVYLFLYFCTLEICPILI
ncbi:MAG: DUF4271 domain-containing protein, partial [Flavobacterium sp.]